MISSLTITDPSHGPIDHGAKVPWFAELGRIEFDPGLNVIVGPNGSGKTTLIRTIAALGRCLQGGTPKDTNQSAQMLQGKTGASVETDGAPTFLVDPELSPGLIGGMAAFDWDFAEEGTSLAMFRGSHGEATLHRMVLVLKGLKGHVGDGRPTVLLDEGERSLDLTRQLDYWRGIRSNAIRAQVIASTHNPFALWIPGARYIETISGYLQFVRRAVLIQISAALGGDEGK